MSRTLSAPAAPLGRRSVDTTTPRSRQPVEDVGLATWRRETGILLLAVSQMRIDVWLLPKEEPVDRALQIEVEAVVGRGLLQTGDR